MSKKDGNLKFKNIYEGTVQNVYKSVLLGKAAAGVTLDSAFEKEQPEVSGQLRIILRTGKLAAHPLSIHARLPKKIRSAIADAVLGLGRTAGAKELLHSVGLSMPVPVDYASDYAGLEEIDMDVLGLEGPDK